MFVGKCGIYLWKWYNTVNTSIIEEGIKLFELLKYKNVTRKHGAGELDCLCNIVISHKIIGFVDKDDNVYLFLPNKGIICPVNDHKVYDYFIYAYSQTMPFPISDQKRLRNFLELLESLCRSKAETRHYAFRRIGMKDNKIYLDLCNENNEAVEIDSEGYRVITNPPVIFLRDKKTQPLPLPKEADKNYIMKLSEVINCKQEEDIKLLVCYLTHLLFPENYDGAKVILCLEGYAGSAKTTFSKIVKALIDPSYDGLLSLHDKSSDLYVVIKSQWLLAFDNISKISQVISDSLCKASTGGTFSKRRAYTNDDKYSVSIKRCIMLNGISNVIGREDLIDRCVMFYLPTITDNRRSEKEIWHQFNEMKPELLGSLLNILSGTLKELPNIPESAIFNRMADFCKIGCAVEKYMGWEVGTFQNIYSKSLEVMAGNNVDDNIIGKSLIHYLQHKFQDDLYKIGFKFKMTPNELFNILRNHNYDHEFSNLEFPKSLTWFSKELNKLSLTFGKIGIKIERKKSNGIRYVEISAKAGAVNRTNL